MQAAARRCVFRRPAHWLQPRLTPVTFASYRQVGHPLLDRERAAMSSQTVAQPTLTMDMALSATNATLVQLDRGLQGGALEQIRAQTSAPLADRWHGMLNLFMSTVVNNIVPLGFTADQQGVMAYNQQFSSLLATADDKAHDLQRLNKEIWQTMLVKAFGAELGGSITLEQAREIQAKISAHILSPAFLERVDALKQDMGTVEEAQKHSKLLTLIMEGQMEVICEFGYDGDVGFVQYQAQVMEHSQDVIMQSNTAALMSVYERAGLQV